MRVTIRVRPGASRERVGGRYGEGATAALVVAVHAPAVDQRATEAALGSLARALGCPSSAVRLVGGARSRTKVVEVTGDEAEIAARLAALLEGTVS